MSKTFCPLPWLSLSTESQRELRLCCHEDRSTRFLHPDGRPVKLEDNTSPLDHFNHPYYQSIREKMLRGEQPEACKGCYKLEQETGDSPRTEYLERFQTSFNKALSQTQTNGQLSLGDVIYLDVTTDNLCNLMCRMCRPRYSQKIAEQWEAMGWTPSPEETDGISVELSTLLYKKSDVIDHIVSTVQMVTMTGGEPLLSPAVSALIDRLIDSKRAHLISLRFFTNTTYFPQKIFDKLLQFKEVNFFCSIDGAGKTSDYIRFPSKWSTIGHAFDQFIKASRLHHQIKVYVHTVIQAYNITQITDLFSFLAKYEGLTPTLPSFTHVESTLPLGIDVLPKKLLESAQQKINLFIEENEQSLISHHSAFHQRELKKLKSILHLGLNQNQSERFLDFIIYSKKLDKLRHQSLLETYPEFKGVE